MRRGRGSDRTAMDRGCSAESLLVCSAFSFFLRFFLMPYALPTLHGTYAPLHLDLPPATRHLTSPADERA
eukprot:scaffold15696_cov113-Isochrysis_galbana.AAC.1